MPQIHPLVWCAEPISCATHFLGAIGLLFCAVIMSARRKQNGLRTARSLLVFLASGIVVLSASSIYHFLPIESAARNAFQIIDHSAIFVLIAASIAAVHDLTFSGLWRWGVIAAAWLIAAVCIFMKVICFAGISEAVSVSVYLALGWLGCLSVIALACRRGIRCTLPLIYGGIAYTVGAVLEYWQWPVVISGIIGPHEVFHLAVICGIGFHCRFIMNALHEKEMWFEIQTSASKSRPTPPFPEEHQLRGSRIKFGHVSTR